MSLAGSKTEARKQGQQHRLAVANRILQCGGALAVTTADRREVPNAYPDGPGRAGLYRQA